MIIYWVEPALLIPIVLLLLTAISYIGRFGFLLLKLKNSPKISNKRIIQGILIEIVPPMNNPEDFCFLELS